MWWWLAVVACGGNPSSNEGSPAPVAPSLAAEVAAPEPSIEAPPASEEDRAVARGRAAMGQLGGALKARLQAALQEGGPAAAMEVCSVHAPGVARKVADMTGVQVGRSSLRLRNPTNEGPAWVSAWLTQQGERPAAGVEGRAQVVEVAAGRQAQVLAPIGVEPVCLTCHGAPESLAPEVRDLLASRYPDDRATGYAVGDLRGAIWSLVEVEPSAEVATPAAP